MPRSPARPCTQPGGCPELVDGGGRCAEHKHRTKRPSAAARGYGEEWKRTSLAYLAGHPWCAEPGCGQPSVHTDHLDGLGPRGPRGHDPGNLMAMCKPHHSSKTARQSPGGWNRRD